MQVDRSYINHDSVRALLTLLAEKYSEKTKFMAVPIGTSHWQVFIYDPKVLEIKQKPVETYPYKKLVIEFIPFFGIYAGYCVENDTLYFWRA